MFMKSLAGIKRTMRGGDFSLADLAVYSVILLIGAIEVTHYTRTADFVSDPGYPDIARSILEQGSYQFDFLPETTLPPGFPLILALVGRFLGLSPAVLFRVIAVSATLGLIAAYEVLRRLEDRRVAAAGCLLLGSSTSFFFFNTSLIFPEMPYFLVSTLALLLALKIDNRKADGAPMVWMAGLLGVALTFAVLIRSVGIALLIGLGAWIITSFLMVPEIGRRRLRGFLFPLALGVAAQLGWSTWAQRHQILEWQLPGYPQSYLSQVKVKDGQHPELGMAQLSDIPSRVGRNLLTRTIGFGELLTRRHISAFWPSPAIFGVVILISVGLAASFRNGGQLHDWYFVWEEAIYLLWPWDYRERFLYPVVPLACLYLWRGAKVLRACSILRHKTTGACFLLGGCFLAISSAAFALRMSTFPVDIDHVRGDHLQPIVATLFWVILAVNGVTMIRFHSDRDPQQDAHPSGWRLLMARLATPLTLQFVAIPAVAILIGVGIEQQLVWGRDNLNPDITKLPSYSAIEAAEWIRANEPADRVIMAREQDLVFHYTHRRVVWFPPISDPKVLMDGIRRFHVGVLVVTHHPQSYWLPPEDACFEALLQTYGSAFHLSHRGPDYGVFEIAASPNGT
jgi:hypothetical protein